MVSRSRCGRVPRGIAALTPAGRRRQPLHRQPRQRRARERAQGTIRRCWCSMDRTSAPEELATRVADLAEVNGFATKLAPLDDFVGKLPEQGGVLIFCASYNGAPPDNATQFVKWLGSDLPKDAFSKVRYVVFGCGNSDWAATYQSIPRAIDEQL